MVDKKLFEQIRQVVNMPVKELAGLAQEVLIENGFDTPATSEELAEMPEMFVWYDPSTGKNVPVRVVKCDKWGALTVEVADSKEYRIVSLTSLCVFELLELLAYFMEE